MRTAIGAGLFVLAGLASANAQDAAGAAVKSWLALDWAAKTEYMAKHGAKPQRDCEPGEEGGPEECWTATTLEQSGWTLTMMKDEGEEPSSVFCFEKTGGLLRWCKDDDTGETQRFFRSGDGWIVHGE